MPAASPAASPAVAGPAPAEWLLLIHQLPAEPAYLRVKTARRLRRLGALQLKSSVYALPATDEASEDLRWLLREVSAEGGSATLVVARLLDGIDDEEVRQMFRSERDGEYDEIVEAARGLDASAVRTDEVQRLRRRLEEVVGRDFFDAPARAAAEHAVAAVEGRRRGPASPAPAGKRRGEARPRGATWVTRRNAKVDRLASGWLIRRFIDPAARFVFVDPAGHRPAAGELRFDMYEGEYGHEGERCTFETLLARFALDEPALHRVGEVVHDLDCKESRFGHPEAAGVAALVQGLAAAYPDDEERLQAAMPLFEALYRSFGAAG